MSAVFSSEAFADSGRGLLGVRVGRLPRHLHKGTETS